VIIGDQYGQTGGRLKEPSMARVVLAVLFLFTQNAMSQTTFHGNNARTGVSDSAGPKVLGGLQWRFRTGGPIVSSPAIANGVVFIGSSDGALYAIDQNTGKQK
jgi:eukaryotic-like serine/threonine-protein kinase